MRNLWFGTSPSASKTDPARESAAGIGLLSHRGWEITGACWSPGPAPSSPPVAGLDTPCMRALAPLPGPFPWSWPLCPPVPPPLQGGLPRLNVRFHLGLGHRQEMRTKISANLLTFFSTA
ncbi:hypothetical protein DMR_01630 [Solidesulfovibrio magneticus RS-1]|uniref:Uncharacterized protein n=1 Tax=Solidesulfovibrio magneticus (strain ATCC 700980 / DSM 13731 / RS-1) TaxID=573370 RepID=C4XTY9_SOLM1|nr:hypothetical protein DMR_01630 [Solidesulfovibrio magneticus RS-1]